jgi:DNA-binding transcriptional LysR family regulator
MKIGDLKGLKSGRLQVAIVTTAKYFVPRLLGPFCRRYPGIAITLEIANRDQVLERLAENRDDLYIMGIPPEKFAIERFAFLENPLVVIAPREHELAGRRRIASARIAKEPFIMREHGSGTRMAVERFFDAHGLALNVKMTLGSNEAIKWAVAGGLGIAVLSQHALMFEPMHHRIAVLDVKGFPISQSWHVVYPAGKQLSVLAATFIDYLKQEAQLIREEMRAEERGRKSAQP